MQNTVQAEVLQQFPLVIRIDSGPYQGNTFNIATPKTLIRGQADNEAQCVIYRGWDTTVVQDLAGNTLVNGQTVFEKELNVGDVIECGSVKLCVDELLHPRSTVLSAPAATASDHQTLEQKPEQPSEPTQPQPSNERFQQVEQRLDQYQGAIEVMEETQPPSNQHSEEIRKVSTLVSQLRTELEVSKSQLLDVRSSLLELKASRAELISLTADRGTAADQKIEQIAAAVDQLRGATSENLSRQLASLDDKICQDIEQLKNSFNENSFEKATKLQQLFDQLAGFQHQLAHCTSQLNSLDIPVDQSTTIAEIQGRLEKSNLESQDSASRVMRLADSVEKVNEVLKLQTEQLNHLDEQLGRFESDVVTLNRSFDARLEQNNEQLRHSIIEHVDATDGRNWSERSEELHRLIDEKIIESRKETHEIQAERSQIDDQKIQELSSKLENNLEQIRQSQEQGYHDVAALGERSDHLEDRANRFEHQLETCRQANESNSNEINSVREQMSLRQEALSDQLSQMENSNQQRSNQVEQRTDQLEQEVQQEFQQLRQANDENSMEINSVREQMASQHTVLSDQLGQMENSSCERSSHLEQRAERLEQDVQQEFQHLRQANDENSTEINSVREQMESQQAALSDQLDQLENSNCERSNRLEQRTERLEQEVQQEFHQLRQSNNDNSMEIASFRQQMSEEHDAVKGQIGRLDQSLNQHSSQLESQSRQFEDLQRSTDSNAAEIKSLHDHTSEKHEAIGMQLGQLEQSINQRSGELEDQTNQFEQKFDALNQRSDSNAAAMESLREQVAQRHDILTNQFGQLERSLNGRSIELEHCTEQHEQEFENLRQAIDSNGTEINSVKEQAHRKREKLASQIEQIGQSLDEQTTTAENRAEQFEQKFEDLSRANDSNSADIGSIKSKVFEAHQELTHQLGQLEHSVSDCSSNLEKRTNQLEQEFENLRQTSDSNSNEINAIREKTIEQQEALSNQLGTLQQSQTDQQSQLEESQKQLDAQFVALQDRAKHQFETLEQKLHAQSDLELDKQIEAVNQQVFELAQLFNTHIDKTLDDSQSFSNRNESIQTSIDEIQRQIEEVTSKSLDEIKQQQSEQFETVEKNRQKLESFENDLAGHTQQIEKLDSHVHEKLDEIKQRFDSSFEQLSNVQQPEIDLEQFATHRQIESIQESLTQVKESLLQQIQTDLDAARDQLAEQDQKFERWSEQSQQRTDEFENRVLEIENRLSDRSDIEHLKSEFESIRQRCDQMESTTQESSDSHDLSANIAELQQRLLETTNRIDEVDSLKTRIEELETTISQYQSALQPSPADALQTHDVTEACKSQQDDSPESDERAPEVAHVEIPEFTETSESSQPQADESHSEIEVEEICIFEETNSEAQTDGETQADNDAHVDAEFVDATAIDDSPAEEASDEHNAQLVESQENRLEDLIGQLRQEAVETQPRDKAQASTEPAAETDQDPESETFDRSRAEALENMYQSAIDSVHQPELSVPFENLLDQPESETPVSEEPQQDSSERGETIFDLTQTLSMAEQTDEPENEALAEHEAETSVEPEGNDEPSNSIQDIIARLNKGESGNSATEQEPSSELEFSTSDADNSPEHTADFAESTLSEVHVESDHDIEVEVVDQPEPQSTDEAEPADDAAENQPSENESVADVLARMNLAPTFENDQSPAAEPTPIAETPTAEVSSMPADSSAANSETESVGDVSVEEYMSKLLSRLDGDPEKSTQDAPAASPSPVSNSVADILQPRAKESAEVKPLTPAEYVPRQSAPEKQADFGALREIANATTREAVSLSDSKKKRSALSNYLMAAIGLAIAGLGLFLFTESGLNMQSMLSVALLGAGGYCGFKYYQLTKQKELKSFSNSEKTVNSAGQVIHSADSETSENQPS